MACGAQIHDTSKTLVPRGQSVASCACSLPRTIGMKLRRPQGRRHAHARTSLHSYAHACTHARTHAHAHTSTSEQITRVFAAPPPQCTRNRKESSMNIKKENKRNFETYGKLKSRTDQVPVRDFNFRTFSIPRPVFSLIRNPILHRNKFRRGAPHLDSRRPRSQKF